MLNQESTNELNNQNNSSLFQFKLDDFQQLAINHLQEGISVIVCAPTGAGKTAIAEYAVAMAIKDNKRCYYTTPLKALSNQKFHDFQLAYGAENVGLLTGDTSINRDAPIVVMTTEVFRNMLYGTIFGEVKQNLRNVAYVVLDECHYMNDAERGTVWEESIIYAPRGLQLIALSATIANAQELTNWIDEAHGPSALVSSDFRPVPLRFYYFAERKLYPLLDNSRQIHPALRGKYTKTKGRKGPRYTQRGSQVSHPADVVAALADRKMLPAIYFVFSRRGCEQAMRHCANLPLVTEAEAKKIKEAVEAYFIAHPNSGLPEHAHMPYLLNGIAVHHAGMLPSWKGLVERLFQQGFIKVVFATETLAAGINMPARTTVISSLEKRTDEGHRQLKASEFLQMSGRAGRRGMDELGHVVILHHPFESVQSAARLAVAPPDPLISQFSPSYGMVLNLLETHTPEQAKDLIEASFGQYLVSQSLEPFYEEHMALEQKIESLKKMPGQEKKIDKTVERLKFLQKHIQRQTSKYWSNFQALSNILTFSGYLDGHKPTKIGHLAQGIRALNEFFLTEVCISDALVQLEPDEFAAIITALITEANRYEDRMRANHMLTPQIAYTLGQIDKIARRVIKLQRQFSVDIPVQYASTFCYLTQRWAQGESWQDLTTNSRLDEGDIVRVLRRTLDMCRQIRRANGMDDKLVELAAKAEKLISRDEISEDTN